MTPSSLQRRESAGAQTLLVAATLVGSVLGGVGFVANKCSSQGDLPRCLASAFSGREAEEQFSVCTCREVEGV